MKGLECLICGSNEDEVEYMIGINYSDDKKDVALCGECVITSNKILDGMIFTKRLKTELLKLEERVVKRIIKHI